jgi:methylenetetrahydrofolate dehydrogenase (NADP+)/methenyltetrahydrofolate cyclohydrolase
VEFFDGKKEASKLDTLIINYLEDNPKIVGQLGKLAIVNFSDNPESKKYTQLKKRYCEKLDLDCEVYDFNNTKDQKEAGKIIGNLSKDPDIKSIIVQLPLPNNIRYDILDRISVKKDVDALSKSTQENMIKNEPYFISPIIRSFIYFINYHNIGLNSKKHTVSLIGNGSLIGVPLSYYLTSIKAPFEIITNYDKGTLVGGDIVVCGVGIPKLISGKDMKKDAYVIDFGSTIVDGKTIGDLDMTSELDHLKAVSGSPGGLGPLVIRFLIMNHLGIK